MSLGHRSRRYWKGATHMSNIQNPLLLPDDGTDW